MIRPNSPQPQPTTAGASSTSPNTTDVALGPQISSAARARGPTTLPNADVPASAPDPDRLPLGYRMAIDAAPEAVVVADAEGRILRINQRATTLFGYAGTKLEGKTLDVLVPQWCEHAARLSRSIVSSSSHLPYVSWVLPGRRRGGATFHIHILASVLFSTTPALVVVAMRRVQPCRPDLGAPPGALNPEEHQTARALARALAQVRLRLATEQHTVVLRQRKDAALLAAKVATAQMQALQTLTDTALAHLDRDDLLPALLDRVRDVLVVDNAIVFLLEAGEDGDGEDGDREGRQRLVVRAARGPQAALTAGAQVPLAAGFVGRVAAARTPRIASDLSCYPEMRRRLQGQASSAVGVPLVQGERVIGVLCVMTIAPRRFTRQDVALLQRVAERFPVAIDQAQRYEAERRARAEAEAARAAAEAAHAEAQIARAEAERRAEELARVFEAMADGVAVYDQDGREVRTNASYQRLIGLDAAPSEYAQLSLQERMGLFVARDEQGRPLSPAEGPLPRALAGQIVAGAEAMDIRSRTLDGREVELRVSAAPIRTPIGQQAGVVCVYRDITERNQLAREREEARAGELALREVNERLDTFVSLATHDLRRPVTVSMMRLELAQRRIIQAAANIRGTSKQIQPFVEAVREVSVALDGAEHDMNRLWGLMQQLLDVTRARQGILVLNRNACNLTALVRAGVEEQRVLAPDRTLSVDLPSAPDGGQPPVMVDADADRLSQVLTNYLTNAERYSPTDHPIEIALRVDEQAIVGAHGRLARVSVRDHGPGIAAEEQRIIWDRFQRARNTREARGGLGLGLYIARMIVELHGGQVGVDSTPSEGATFWFTLPLAPTGG